jgi:3-hydroxyacyl-[acyl-carrier-protein] dehydratase
MPKTLTDTAVQCQVSPLVGSPQIRERWPDKLLTSMHIDPSEPVFEGHFPGFAIFPGVCLIECAHQSALLAVAQRSGAGTEPQLAALETVRFLNAVYPGDQVLVEVGVLPLDDGWRCRARVLVRRPDSTAEPVEAAVLKLRYATRARLT